MISSLTFPRPSVDGPTFVHATDRLAGSVAVVSWLGDGPEGLLVSGISLLSTRPPRVLFAVAKEAAGHGSLLQAQTCSLNLLSDADQSEAERFGLPHAAGRFASGRWRILNDRPPKLDGGAAYLFGFIDQRIDAGSHSLFVIRVEEAEALDRLPLVSCDRQFRRLAGPSQSAGAQICAMRED